MPEEEIKSIVSVLTIVGGRIVHGDREFTDLAPPLPPAMPEWSPVRTYGGYHQASLRRLTAMHCSVHRHAHAAAASVHIGLRRCKRILGRARLRLLRLLARRFMITCNFCEAQ